MDLRCRNFGMIPPFKSGGGAYFQPTPEADRPPVILTAEQQEAKTEQAVAAKLSAELKEIRGKDLPQGFLDDLQKKDPPLYETLINTKEAPYTQEALDEVNAWLDMLLYQRISPSIIAAFPHATSSIDITNGRVDVVLFYFNSEAALKLTKTPTGPWFLDGDPLCSYGKLEDALNDAKILQTAFEAATRFRLSQGEDDYTQVMGALDRSIEEGRRENPYTAIRGTVSFAKAGGLVEGSDDYLAVKGNAEALAARLNAYYRESKALEKVEAIKNQPVTAEQIAKGYTGAGIYKGIDVDADHPFTFKGRWKNGAVYDGWLEYGDTSIRVLKPDERGDYGGKNFVTFGEKRYSLVIEPKTMKLNWVESPKFMSWEDFQKMEAHEPATGGLKDGYEYDDHEDGYNYAYHAVETEEAAETVADASTNTDAEPVSTLERPVETASKTVDEYRADAALHPNNYLKKGDDDSVIFDTKGDIAAEKAIRVQDLYGDHKEMVFTSTRYPKLTFTYQEEGVQGPSWYDKDGSGQRLAILNGDALTEVKPAQVAEVVVDPAPAQEAPVAVAPAPEVLSEPVPNYLTLEELNGVALQLSNDQKVLEAARGSKDEAENALAKNPLFKGRWNDQLAGANARIDEFTPKVEEGKKTMLANSGSPAYATVAKNEDYKELIAALNLPKATEAMAGDNVTNVG